MTTIPPADRGCGYRHVTRKHGWDEGDKLSTGTTLSTPDLTVTSGSSVTYYLTYVVGNVSRTRKVVVEYDQPD